MLPILLDPTMDCKCLKTSRLFLIKGNADKKVTQLKQLGYNARYIGANRYGLHQVSYASFSDNKEALKLYRKIKRSTSPDVWILSDK